MRRKKRALWLLVLSFSSLATLIYLVVSFSPSKQFTLPLEAASDAAKWGHFPLLPVFFILLFLFVFSLIAYLLNNARRGLFAAFFITTYLLLRFFHLTHIFFLIILIALFFTLELLFTNRK